MFSIFKDNPRYVIGALIVHVILIALVAMSFHWTSKPNSSAGAPETIKVKAISEKKVDEEMKKISEAETQQQREVEQKVAQQQQQLQDLRKQQEEELKKRDQQSKKIAFDQEREKKRLKELEEKRRQEELKQEQTKREKSFKEKVAVEEKRLEEEQKNLLAERQQQESAALGRKQEEKRRQTIIDKYRDIITAYVRRHWIEPPNAKETLVCILQIKLIPSGDVVNIKVAKSSGDPVFDRSVENAVRKASPLPMPPPETGLVDAFRDLEITFGKLK
jgi:colicin import membrane protein